MFKLKGKWTVSTENLPLFKKLIEKYYADETKWQYMSDELLLKLIDKYKPYFKQLACRGVLLRKVMDEYNTTKGTEFKTEYKLLLKVKNIVKAYRKDTLSIIECTDMNLIKKFIVQYEAGANKGDLLSVDILLSLVDKYKPHSVPIGNKIKAWKLVQKDYNERSGSKIKSHGNLSRRFTLLMKAFRAGDKTGMQCNSLELLKK